MEFVFKAAQDPWMTKVFSCSLYIFPHITLAFTWRRRGAIPSITVLKSMVGLLRQGRETF